MEEANCEHLFEAKISKRQDIVNRYLTDGRYLTKTLEQEVVNIFCVHCGQSRVINESIGLVNEG